MKNTDFTPYIIMSPIELRRYQKKQGWALSLVGLIIYGVLRLFRQNPKDYKGICQYFEIGKGWGGFSVGWFFVCCKDAGEHTKNHEVGHLIQNAAVGGLTMVAYSIGSALRYWRHTIFGSNQPYDSWFFEGDATRIGTQYVRYIEEKKKE